MNLWTILASLLCSLSFSDGAFQVQQQVRLAAIGNPAAISRLSDVVGRMAGAEAAVVAPPIPTPVRVSLPPPSASRRDIATLTSWVRQQGRTSALDGPASKLLGLSEGTPLPVVRKAYEDDVTNIVYAFNLVSVDGTTRIVMIRTTNELSAHWLISDDGKILRAAEATRSVRQPVPNDKYFNYWLETKDYLLNEMSKAAGVAQGSAAPKI